MNLSKLAPNNTVFVILSFEGPDPYSLAGGLGVRVANLTQTLSTSGFLTHLFFVGDPWRKGEEVDRGERLILHRWCQWISEHYPNGVYQGENDKVNDFTHSIPPFVIDRVIKPALAEDKLVVILAEEWHTAEVVCHLSEQLRSRDLRDSVVVFWNANNTFAFDRIDWQRLAKNATLTTVSRYMKYIMRERGVNPLVIPNGIPEALLVRANENESDKLRDCLEADLLLTKVARYDPAKGWQQAVEATAGLKRRGKKAVLLARGGIESYGEEVLHNARHLNLKVRDVTSVGNSVKDGLEAIASNNEADVANIKFHCKPDLLHILYHASDAVLSNSSHEPFGLVGLETMAAGGIAFTGGTGEDYASHLHNAIVLETEDPREIEEYVTYLASHAEQREKIRKFARATARRFTWQAVLGNLLEKLENQASSQDLLDRAAETPVLEVESEPLHSLTAATSSGSI